MIWCPCEMYASIITQSRASFILACTGLYAEILQRGGELGVFKKEGVQLQAASGGALIDNVKKLVW